MSTHAWPDAPARPTCICPVCRAKDGHQAARRVRRAHLFDKLGMQLAITGLCCGSWFGLFILLKWALHR